MSDSCQFHELVEKIRKLNEGGEYDLSMEEDLSLAVMNLVSLEEHLFLTSQKTGKDGYLDWMQEVREMRKTLLGRLMPQHEGETWCISKHLLATTMRLIEVGTKLQSLGQVEKAKETFGQAYKIYSIFWAIRFNLLDAGGVKKLDEDKPWQVEDLVTKLVDCCKE